jgi:hypothetical protein
VRAGLAPPARVPKTSHQPLLAHQAPQGLIASSDGSRGNAPRNAQESASPAGSWWPLACVAVLLLLGTVVAATLFISRRQRPRS